MYHASLRPSYQFPFPVFSIGNLALGGAGKTPVALWVLKNLERNKKKPIIALRGYKGKYEKSQKVLKACDRFSANAELFGDEAILYARNLERTDILVGANRVDNINNYLLNNNPDCLVLDDGYQHLKISREHNILVFDCSLPLASYVAPPLGYLREGLNAARDADFVIFNKVDQIHAHRLDEFKKKIFPHMASGTPYAECYYESLGLFNYNDEQLFSLEDCKNLNSYVVSGIASQRPFLKSLEHLKINIFDSSTLPDHHKYTQDEWDQLLLLAEQMKCQLVTTEKDLVKIPKRPEFLGVSYLKIDLKFQFGEKELREFLQF